jgi:hypothetical protein
VNHKYLRHRSVRHQSVLEMLHTLLSIVWRCASVIPGGETVASRHPWRGTRDRFIERCWGATSCSRRLAACGHCVCSGKAALLCIVRLLQAFVQRSQPASTEDARRVYQRSIVRTGSSLVPLPTHSPTAVCLQRLLTATTTKRVVHGSRGKPPMSACTLEATGDAPG